MGGPGHLCCRVWCPGGGWLEGRAQLAPFSLHEVPASPCGLCRLLSRWLKTLRESVQRYLGKSSEASEELTSKALGCPFCHILLSGRSLDQSRVKKRGKTFLLNGGQLQLATDVFQLHGFSHGALEFGSLSFSMRGYKNESLLPAVLTIELLVLRYLPGPGSAEEGIYTLESSRLPGFHVKEKTRGFLMGGVW